MRRTIALVPGHFLADLEPLVSRLPAELVPYDAHGEPAHPAPGASVFFRWWLTPEEGDRVLGRHSSIRWVHSGSAGIDHILTPLFLARAPQLTNSAGVHAPSIAEWVVGAMLSVVKNLPAMARAQERREFEKVQRPELTGQKAVFIGAGQIATEIAQRLAPFRMRLAALRASGRSHEAIPSIIPFARLREEVADADWLIITAPLTKETAGIIDRALLEALPSRARVINVSRGELLDEEALADLIGREKLAGAILDVFREEPLPPDHLFWTLPGLLVFPHTTWRSPQVKERQLELFADNLRRFVSGEMLRNVVDPSRGY
ncbi:MAG: D-2-hydroxyacid dehydrogenase [Thermoanaerobaculia bacterium]